MKENAMNNVKADPLLVHDDDLRRIIDNLDQVRVGLSDMQAAPVLNDEPAIQQDLYQFSKIVRSTADALADLRNEQHLRQLRNGRVR
jgi:hypothetical protein